jgi:hypothetical protein
MSESLDFDATRNRTFSGKVMMQSKIVNVTERTTDWNSVNWKSANRVVRRLRQRIFNATKDGDTKRVRNLQKLLIETGVPQGGIISPLLANIALHDKNTIKFLVLRVAWIVTLI